MADKVRYWIELSDYDLDTAQAMLETSRFLYVGFMCHPRSLKGTQGILEQSAGGAAFEDSSSVKTGCKVRTD